MTYSVLELLIIAAIILGIGIVIWKGGSANPEGTKTLGDKVNQVSADVGKVSGEVRGLTGRVKHVESDVEELKRESATTKDIERVEALAERTWRSVDRIERMLIEKGLGK